jgi:hypothetical protein
VRISLEGDHSGVKVPVWFSATGIANTILSAQKVLPKFEMDVLDVVSRFALGVLLVGALILVLIVAAIPANSRSNDVKRLQSGTMQDRRRLGEP